MSFITCPNRDPGKIVIIGNRIYDSVRAGINNTNSSPTVFPQRVIFSGNYLENTRLNLTRCRYIVVSDNRIYDPGDTATNEINVQDSKYVTVLGNTIIGGVNWKT